MSGGLLRNASVVMIVTVIAKIIGFLRETTIGYYFGANAETDIFYIANGLVNGVVFAMTASLSVAFIPIYTKAKASGKKTFLLECILFYSLLSLFITLLFVSLSDKISLMLAPSYSTVQREMLSYYLNLFSIGIIFSVLANLFISTLNAEGRFGYAALSGMIFSITNILFVVFLHKQMGISSLVYSIVVAYFIQSVVLLGRVGKYMSISNIHIKNLSYLKELLNMTIPVLISNVSVEINHLVDRILASKLNEGAVSALSYSNTLFNFVFHIVCNTFITIYYTRISRAAVEHNYTDVFKDIKEGIEIICFIVVPIIAITIVYAMNIVTIAFKRGKFDDTAVNLTAVAIAIYSCSFLCAGLYMLFNKVFFVLGDYKTPTFLCLISVVINIFLSLLLSKILGFKGIVIATVVANIILAASLLIKIIKKFKMKFECNYIVDIIKYIVAGLLVLVLLSNLHRVYDVSNCVLDFVIGTGMAFSMYIILLRIMRCNMLLSVLRLIKSRLNRSDK